MMIKIKFKYIIDFLCLFLNDLDMRVVQDQYISAIVMLNLGNWKNM